MKQKQEVRQDFLYCEPRVVFGQNPEFSMPFCPGVPPAYLQSPAAVSGPAASEDDKQPLLTLLAQGGQVEFSNLGSCCSLACLWQTNFMGCVTANIFLEASPW